MGAIFYQANQDPYSLSALGQLAGTFLGQKQKQARQNKANMILNEALSYVPKEGEDNTLSPIQRAIQEAGKQGVDLQSLTEALGMTPFQARLQEMAPYAKEQARSKAASMYLDKIMGNNQASQQTPLAALDSTQSVSPDQMSQPSVEDKEKLALSLAASPYPEHRAMAKVYQSQLKSSKDVDQRRQERNFQLNKPLYEDISSLRRGEAERDIAIERVNDAIESGDFNKWTDWAGNLLGVDPLKSTQAQILDSAVKSLFLNDLKSIQGGRLNQLIESNLLKAYPSAGKDPKANAEIVQTIKTLNDILKEKTRIFDDLSKYYEDRGVEPPRDIEKQINDRLNPFVKDRMKELNELRKSLAKSSKAKSPKEGLVVMKKDGKIFNIPKDEFNESDREGLIKEGYEFL